MPIINKKIYLATGEGTELKIYFRIPFTVYFVGRVLRKITWSKLCLFRKVFEYGNYFYEIV
jgi:hypothetical protein